jgi:hypothetical protein
MPRKENILASKSGSADYGEFLKSVKPIGIALTTVSSHLNREAYGELLRNKDKTLRLISTEYKLLEAEKGYFDSSGNFSLIVKAEKKSDPALKIECCYETHFHCQSPVVREMADQFTSSELRLVLWPYFRELVFDLCGKMSIPPITIPLTTSSDE